MLRIDAALERARALAVGPQRRILGIAGPPGGGKSTLAELIACELGDRVRVVGMDGFHLAQCELERLGRADRKGAIDTFDVAGYVALLRRLRDPADGVVYAPMFRRDLEEPVGSAVAVPADVPLVVTEGNYLLVGDGPWAAVRPLLDEGWYVATPEPERLRRLVQRHIAHGRPRDAATAWARGSDQRNAELIETTRHRADRVIDGSSRVPETDAADPL